jgi:hypothetical protein
MADITHTAQQKMQEVEQQYELLRDFDYDECHESD